MRVRHALVAIVVVLCCASGTRAGAQTAPAAGSSSSSSTASGWSGRKIRIGVSGGIQTGAPAFTQQETFQIYAENAPIAVAYANKNGLLVGGSVGVHVKGPFGAGVAVSYARSHASGHVTGEIPHPFHFDEQRPIDGTAAGLPQTTIGTHVQILYLVPAGDTVDVMLSAGPSIISVRQDLVNTVNFSEAYPYDTATFESADPVRGRKSALGFNAGADVTWHATPAIGVGVLLRYTRARVTLPVTGQPAVEAQVGGVQAGVGIRLMF